MLRQAVAGDLAFVAALVQRPENSSFLTNEPEDALARYLVEPSSRLLIWGDRRGFALFCGIGQAGDVVELRRLCLDQPGQGEGAEFLRCLIARAFADYDAARLWLDCSGENLRAQRVYARAGFTLEGRLRSHDHKPMLGRSVDQLLYGMMRDEWAAAG